MTNASLLIGGKKKELMVQLGMNKCYQEYNQNLSSSDAVCYQNRTAVIALVLLKSVPKFLKPILGTLAVIQHLLLHSF